MCNYTISWFSSIEQLSKQQAFKNTTTLKPPNKQTSHRDYWFINVGVIISEKLGGSSQASNQSTTVGDSQDKNNKNNNNTPKKSSHLLCHHPCSQDAGVMTFISTTHTILTVATAGQLFIHQSHQLLQSPP